ncbi:MAG TPA: ABC transporter ATP-binding protein, partial [Thermoplasmata archaeon]|nr:ABC transporter ATP-binding protein [Thermoplasmata archaeon]
MTAPLLQTVGLVKHFPLVRSLTESLRRQSRLSIHALDGVSVEIGAGETLGLIGETGSGKTTLGWLVARLHEATAGQILFDGQDVTNLKGAELRAWRRNVQIVFQDPVGSLDPRMRVWEIVSEPLRAQRSMGRWSGGRTPGPGLGEAALVGAPRAPSHSTKAGLRAEVAELLPTVGLPPDCLDQYPHEFSGGGRQRISLARALSLRPRLLVLDEPTSALDVAVQAQILNRLVALQREMHLAYLLITHNVAAVKYVADRVAVLYLGKLAEVGAVRDVLERPLHPYTKALLAALPVPDVRRRRSRFRISGDIPTLVSAPPGCRFATRCPFVID